jgi:hypothetical protein
MIIKSIGDIGDISNVLSFFNLILTYYNYSYTAAVHCYLSVEYCLFSSMIQVNLKAIYIS